MLKLRLQYLGHLTQTAGSLEKSLMLGKIEGRRRRGHQRMRWLDGIAEAMEVNLGKHAVVYVFRRKKWLRSLLTVTLLRIYPREMKNICSETSV